MRISNNIMTEILEIKVLGFIVCRERLTKLIRGRVFTTILNMPNPGGCSVNRVA